MKHTYLLCFWLIFTCTSTARAQAPLPADGSFSAAGKVQFLGKADTQPSVTQAIRDSAKFVTLTTNMPQFGMGQPPAWFRCRVANPTPHAVRLIAEIDYAQLQSVQFFLATNAGQVVAQSQPMGWQTPVVQHPWRHYNPLFEFTLQPRQQGWLYTYADAGHGRLAFPLLLHTPVNFLLSDREQRSIYGYATGFLGFIVFFSLLLFVQQYDRLYLFYGLYALAGFVYLTATEGYWFVWLDRPMYGFVPAGDLAELSLYAQTLAGIGFTRWYVLHPVMHLTWLRRIFWVAVGGQLINTALLLLLLNGPVYQWYLQHRYEFHLFMGSSYAGSVLLMMGAGIWLSLQSPRSPAGAAARPARLYMIAITPPLLQIGLALMRNGNLIPDHVLYREGVVLTSLLEFMILAVGLGYRYKRITDERRALVIETAKQRQQATETQLLLQQEQNRVLAGQLQLQEEKERIARDLHDHVGSQLSIIANSLEYAGHEPINGNRVAAVGSYVHEAMQSLRDTIWAIHQEEISLAEFRIHVRQYLARQQELVENPYLLLQGSGGADVCLSSFQALSLFRILQEALQNALKYARADQITLTLRLNQNREVELLIEDNGIGFLPGTPDETSTHYGLQNMAHRAGQLGAQYQILSGAGQGTRVAVQMAVQMQPSPENSVRATHSAILKNTAVAV